jgi:hypothetical protein
VKAAFEVREVVKASGEGDVADAERLNTPPLAAVRDVADKTECPAPLPDVVPRRRVPACYLSGIVCRMHLHFHDATIATID